MAKIFDTLFNHLVIEKQYVPSRDDKDFFVDAGSPYAISQARTLAPVARACINLKANALAVIPKSCVHIKNPLYEYYINLPNHPVTALLNYPSSVFDPYQFWSFVAEVYNTHWNAYIRIKRNANQEPVELVPCIVREYKHGTTGNRRRFIQEYMVSDVTDLDHTIPVRPRNLITIHGPGFNGYWSPSPIQYAAMRTLEIMGEANKHIEENLKKGVNISNVIVADKPEIAQLKIEAIQELIATVRDSYAGAQAAGKVPVIPPGFTMKELTNMSNTDLQLIELLKYNLEDICRIWNTPPRMVFHYHTGQRVFKEGESPSEDFVKWSIAPDAQRFWSQLTSKLVSVEDIKKDYAVRFHTDAIGEASWSQRARIAGDLVSKDGLYTPNEGRELMRRGPMPDGDKLRIPKGAPGEDNQPGGDNGGDDGNDGGDDGVDNE